jgi:hypothetical protein
VKHSSILDSPDAPGLRRQALNIINPRMVALTLFNAPPYWPWHWLRNAFERGIHHPNLVLVMIIVTLWGWWQLHNVIALEVNARSRH